MVKKIGWLVSLLLFSALACKALAPGLPLQDQASGTVELSTRVSSTVLAISPTQSPPSSPTASLPPTDLPQALVSPASIFLPQIALPPETELSPQTIPPTVTASPSETPTPTATPTPTQTALPSITPIIPQYPLVFSGSGARVLEVNKWQGPAIARITHTGLSYFTVESFDASGRHLEFLVDTIGDYSGTLPVDFDKTATRRLTINADGTWGIQFLPVSSAQMVPVPGTISGKGQQVFSLVGLAPDLITVDASQATGTFIIQVYKYKQVTDYLGLLVTGVAPFTGAYMAPSGANLLTVTAAGPWKMDLTGK
jgi:hypothetical protein